MPHKSVDSVVSSQIASGQTESEVLDLDDFKGAFGFVIGGPATLPETITVEVSFDNSTFYTLQSSGNDVEISAGDAVPITFLGWKYMKLVAGSAVGSDRDFEVGIVWEHR